VSGDPAARQAFIGETYSSFYSYVNFTGFALQMFVVSRVFKFLGVGRALFIHPVVALSGYLMMIGAPSFQAIRLLKIADNSLDYSLGNTTKQALWLPTSREAKYKAKQAVDSFCQRAGDVLQAGIVYIGELVRMPTGGFAVIGAVFALGWFSVAYGLRRKLAAHAHETGRKEL
jgi:AAA family ATP:ADP antiporter